VIDRTEGISPARPPWLVRERDPEREQQEPRREPPPQSERDEDGEGEDGHIDVRA
jgi:hypothetical protein